ncbi:MAG: hypothetical protein KBA28_02780 [Syntrophaceae bacterium]|jgi:hypothetical protein|nr:hypothetical protein [Syntrophaceae bacterium]
MPVYVQILLLCAAFIVFVFTAMYLTGLGLRRVCFKIIAELEQARAFSEKRAMKLQDERKNFFLVGANNLRPKALNVLLADKLVIRTSDGRYYLDREKLAEVKNNIGR